jgi:hypothetical protein
MVDQRGAARVAIQEPEKPEIVAAREELSTLDRLSQAIIAKISELLRQRPQFDRRSSAADFALHEVRYSSLKGYEELADHCYGRTVLGKEIDEDGRAKSQFTYRITQANVGYVESSCYVLARNSPIASKLVTANPGDESEVVTRSGTRTLKIDEVRTFDGPVSLRSPSQKPNFRVMTLQQADSGEPLAIHNLRAFLHALVEQTATDANTVVAETLPAKVDEASREVVGREDRSDPMWLQSWRGVYLSDSETSSLGHQFFTRPTPKQEAGLNNPHGLTFVEGIAGAGKTSVALGRLKFFANFSTGEYREHYDLQNALANDFSPVGMVGYVLSHSLKRYLKETAIALGLPELSIRDFQEFRTDLSNQFGLAQRFKRSKSEVTSCRTRLAWLLAVDAAMARVAGTRLREVVTHTPDVPTTVKEAVFKIASELSHAEVRDQAEFYLGGLAHRVIANVMEVEFRTREISIREQMNREKSLIIRKDLEGVLARTRKEEERQTLTPLARRLLASIAASDLLILAVQLQEFPQIVREAFGYPTDAVVVQELDTSIEAIRALLAIEDGARHRSLTDADLVTLITLAAMIADEFGYADAPTELYQIRRNTAVFIDEVQDFTEVEILLMGMSATRKYHQITLSGDLRQRLQSMGAEEYQKLFPSVPKLRHNQQIFLNRNFRQRKELAVLSAGIRSVLQEDRRVATQLETAISPAPVYTFNSPINMAHLILERIQTVDPYATVAVIAPTEAEARRWYDLLHDDLAADHRPALLSHRDDLTRRDDIHFTDVRETKGLEFDVVIIPDLGSFPLNTIIGRNQLYVAISRPKHSLLMGCDERSSDRQELKKLVFSGLVRLFRIPTSPEN